MRFIWITTLLFFTISCVPKSKRNEVFADLADEDSIVIVLKNYHLDSIPNAIEQFENAKSLVISIDSLNKWTIYPPVNAYNKTIDSPPFKYLPQEITELKNLRQLILYALNLKGLPEDFDQLENLEYLDLSMNKLDVSSELLKLKRLKKLKYLVLFGNRIDSMAMQNWKKENPEIEIIY